MNEIALSNNLKQIELEIQWHKENAGRSVWEVGRRLNHVKENDLAHGEFIEWLDVVGIEYTSAKRMMKVAKELSNSATLHHLGETALYLIATLPEEERKKEHTLESGETKTVDEMTVRELQEVKKKNKKLEKEVEELKKREPEIVEIEVDHYHQKYITEQYNNSVLAGKIQDLERSLKNKEINKTEYDELRKELIEKSEENYDLKKQLEQSIKLDSETKHQEKLKDSALIFSTRIHTFLNDVGGLAWLTEYIEELDEYSKNSYYKALDLIEGWVLTVKSNIDKEKLK